MEMRHGGDAEMDRQIVLADGKDERWISLRNLSGWSNAKSGEDVKNWQEAIPVGTRRLYRRADEPIASPLRSGDRDATQRSSWIIGRRTTPFRHCHTLPLPGSAR